MEIYLQGVIGVLLVVAILTVASSVRAIFARDALDKGNIGDVNFKPMETLDDAKDGIGGGLYLVILALVANTAVFIYLTYNDFLLLSDEALTKDFIDQGIEYNENPFKLFFNIRGGVSVLLILASLNTIRLFFAKSVAFRPWFIALFLAFGLAVFADDVGVYYIVQGNSWYHAVYWPRDGLVVFIMLFLVPYIRGSERAKATFVAR